MKIDGIDLINNNDITDAVIEHGTTLPTGMNANDTGRLFALTATDSGNLPGIYWYDSAAWSNVANSNATSTDFKESVRVATTANITLSGTQTIDGVAVIATNRVLVKDQSTASQNGIYVVSAGSWSRSADADISGEVTTGIFCFVEEGTANAGKGFVLTTANPITLGTTSLTFSQFSGSSSYSQGTGITISGPTISLDTSYTDGRYVNTSGDTMTGALIVPVGSVGSPTIAFTSDTDTGLYSTGAGNVSIATDGVQRVSIDATSITLTPGVTNATSAGGNITLQAGDVTGTGSNYLGGTINILAGDGYHSSGASTNGTGGSVNITAGDQLAAFGRGGNITLTTGAGKGPNFGGPTSGVSGTFTAQTAPGHSTASAAGGKSGSINITSGVGGNATGGTDNGGNSGDVFINTGTGGTSVGGTPGTAGSIYIQPAGSEVGRFTTAGLLMISGTSSLPSYTFSFDSTTGMYLGGADVLSFATGGTQRMSINSSSITSTVPYIAPVGSVTTPSYTFNGDSNTGLYQAQNDEISLSCGGAQQMVAGATGVYISNTLGLSNGTVSTPSLSFTNFPTTGIYTSGSNSISLSSYGTEVLTVHTSGLNSYARLFAVDGTASTPAISFNTDTNTGIYSVGADSIGFSAGGSLRMTVSSSSIDVNSLKITSLATPTVSTDAATKGYVDSAIAGLSWKSPVKVATTANITLSGTQTIDGIAVVAADRVLVKNQTTASQNGIYVVASGAWTRATDFDQTSPIDEVNSAAVFVMQGTVNGDYGFVQTSAVTTVGTDTMTFVQFSGSSSYTQGTGISISGPTISLDTSYTDTRYINTSGDTMTGVLSIANGSVGTPSLSFGSFPTTGIYASAGDELSITAGGTKVVSVAASGLYTTTPIYVSGGSAGSPSVSFNTDTNTGMYNSGADELSFTTGGTRRAFINSTGNVGIGGTPSQRLTVVGGSVLIDNATYYDSLTTTSATVRMLGINGSDVAYVGPIDAGPTSTIYSSSSTSTSSSFYTSGTQRLSISTTAITSTLPILVPSGTAGAPGLSFSGDTDTGIYQTAAGNVNISVNGSAIIAASATAGVTLAFSTSNLTVDSAGTSIASGVLLNTAGTAGAPSYTFTGDTNTGIYSSAADQIAFSAGGVARLFVDTVAVTSTVTYLGPDGAVTAPTYRFNTDTNTGMYLSALHELGFATNGIKNLSISTSRVLSGLPIYGPNGAAATPTYTFNSDPTTGLYYSSSTVNISTAGTVRVSVSTTGVVSTLPYYTANGSASAPAFSFNTDSTTGIYHTANANEIGISSNGTNVLSIHTSAVLSTANFYAPNGSSSLPSYAFSADTNTGLASGGADIIAFCTGGTVKARMDGSGQLDVLSGNLSLIIGADNGATTRTNSVSKVARIVVPHYNTAEEPLAAMVAVSGASTSEVYLGGGTGLANTATHVYIYTAANNTSLSGTESFRFTSAGAYNQLGSASVPSYSFNGDADTGMYSGGANTVLLSTNGVARFGVDVTSITAALPVYGVDGAVGAPTYAFNNDPTTGIYKISSGVVGIGTSGVLQLSVSSSGLDMHSNKITSLGTPTVSTDAATKGYVDSVATGLDLKASVKAATTANITLSGTQTIDGVAVVAADRVLVKNQTTASQNGIYDVSAGAWTRSSDADNSPAGEVTTGMFCFVEQGTVNSSTGFVLITANPITLGTTSLSFTAFSSSGASSATNVNGGTAGAVLYQSGINTTAFTSVGTTGQVLTSNGTSAPTWATSAAAADSLSPLLLMGA